MGRFINTARTPGGDNIFIFFVFIFCILTRVGIPKGSRRSLPVYIRTKKEEKCIIHKNIIIIIISSTGHAF